MPTTSDPVFPAPTDPTCARHGMLPQQDDPSAAVIRLFERASWAWDVRWPDPARVAARLVPAPDVKAAV